MFFFLVEKEMPRCGFQDEGANLMNWTLVVVFVHSFLFQAIHFTINGNIFKSKRQVRNVAMVFLYSGQDISFVRQHSPL